MEVTPALSGLSDGDNPIVTTAEGGRRGNAGNHCGEGDGTFEL